MAYDFEGNRIWLSDSQGGSVAYGWYNQSLQSMAMTTEAATSGFTTKKYQKSYYWHITTRHQNLESPRLFIRFFAPFFPVKAECPRKAFQT